MKYFAVVFCDVMSCVVLFCTDLYCGVMFCFFQSKREIPIMNRRDLMRAASVLLGGGLFSKVFGKKAKASEEGVIDDRKASFREHPIMIVVTSVTGKLFSESRWVEETCPGPKREWYTFGMYKKNGKLIWDRKLYGIRCDVGPFVTSSILAMMIHVKDSLQKLYDDDTVDLLLSRDEPDDRLELRNDWEPL